MKKQLIILASGYVGYELLFWLIKKKSKIFHVFSTKKNKIFLLKIYVKNMKLINQIILKKKLINY